MCQESYAASMASHARERNLLLSLLILGASACSSSPSTSPAVTGPPTAGASSTREPATSAPSTSASTPARSAGPGLRVVATRLAFDLPVPMSRAVAFANGQSIVVAGGLSSNGSLRSILSIDPTTGHLVQAGQLAAAVHDAAATVAGGRLLVFGGGNLVPVGTVQQIAGPRATVVGRLPRPRADLAAVTVGARSIIVGGGTPAELDPAILATADGASFRTIGSLRLGARYPAVAAVSGKLLVVGGTDGTRDLNAIQAVDPVSGSVRLIGRLPEGLSHAAAFVLAGRVLVAGGRSAGRAQDRIWEIDPTTGSVTLVGHLPVAISDFAAVVLDGVGYLLGGETDAFQASILVIRLI